mmetsp:Transcript_14292/g.29634  ORF Transcript_14292/g.29634 Transcript_14292/m.29634 type:complete len:126 (-) Transcript_14292:9-386(-)
MIASVSQEDAFAMASSKVASRGIGGPTIREFHERHHITKKVSREFHESQFHIDKILGEGHFGKIYRATMVFNTFGPFSIHHQDACNGSQRYALKRFSKSHMMRASQKKGNRLMELLKREVGVHRR